jgi:transposase InsO family protein
MDDIRAVKSLPFSGKKSDFMIWKAKFLAICVYHQCADILTDENVVAPAAAAVLDPNVPAEATELLLRAQNKKAYMLLTLSITDKVSYDAIINANTTELPSGDAKLAWSHLVDMHQPTTRTELHNLEQQFHQCRLRSITKNPDDWFAQLEHIRVQLRNDHNMVITDDQLKTQILYNTDPEEYKIAKELLKHQLNLNINVTIINIKSTYRQIYGAYVLEHRANRHKGGNSGETALLARGKFTKKFKGDCRHCGRKGHKSPDCWEREQNKAKRPANWKSQNKNQRETAYVATTKYHCEYCGKDNHTEDRCFKKKKDLGEHNPKEQALCVYETALIMAAIDCGMLTDHTFIADTGASSHMVNNKKYLQDIRPFDITVSVGNDAEMRCDEIGTFNGYVEGEKGMRIPISLKDVLYVPSLRVNLLSITKCISSPNVTLFGSKFHMGINFQGHNVKFTKELSHGSGKLFAIDIIPNNTEIALITMDFNHLHSILGHPNNYTLRTTAHHHNIHLKNEPTGPCKYCVRAKIRMKNIPRDANQATRKGERILIDISWVKTPSEGLNNYWLLVMDEFTHYLWSYFLPSKDYVTDRLMPFLRRLHVSQDLNIRYIRCDNAPENRMLQQACYEDPDLNITFEYTAPGTPQQNGKIERKFATLNGKCRAMLNAAEFNWDLRHRMWAHCASLATLLDNVLIRKDVNRSPHKLWHDEDPPWMDNLQPFGTIAIVKHNRKIQSKLKDRGYPAIYIGPAADHSAEVHEFWNPKTKRRCQARNAIFLKQTYSEYYKLPVTEIANLLASLDETTQVYDDDYVSVADSEDIVMVDNSDDEQDLDIWDMVGDNQDAPDMNSDQSSIVTPRFDDSTVPTLESSSRSSRDISTVVTESDYVPHADDNDSFDIEDDDDYREATTSDDDSEHHLPRSLVNAFRAPRELRNLADFLPNPPGPDALQAPLPPPDNESALLATVYDGNPEPKHYLEARTSPDSSNWWEAMCTEFKNMESKEVWQIRPKTEVPTNRKIIGARWVYAKKDDGRYRARCVAKGFSQIPGKDFQENHAPVVSDTTMHILLVIKSLFGLKAGQFDIETAFLYGELEETLWMEIPDGYIDFLKETKNQTIDKRTHCLLLTKAIYGLVQAARQWWKKFKEILGKLSYYPSRADPCLFIKDKGLHNKSFLMIYVDDGGIFSSDENIKEVLKELSKTFVVKDLGTMETFVGCRIVENKSKTAIYVHQPKLIKNLKEHFGDLIKDVRDYKTPAAPRSIIQRPQAGDTLITPQQQTKFRSGVGMLLYLVKHSRFDIANAVRDLSKVADGANHAHWKALLRCIKYVIMTEHMALQMKPDKGAGSNPPFYVEGVSDSDYAGDRDTRQSVYGYIIYFCGAPIAWKSKSSKSVTLSSTEAEYYALSEVTKEIMFIKNVLESMGIVLTLPIKVKVDNVGAIYLSNNFSVGQRTKHIDVRRHYVREYIVDGKLKTSFVPTKHNEADIHTKNTMEDAFSRHVGKNLKDVRYID